MKYTVRDTALRIQAETEMEVAFCRDTLGLNLINEDDNASFYEVTNKHLSSVVMFALVFGIVIGTFVGWAFL